MTNFRTKPSNTFTTLSLLAFASTLTLFKFANQTKFETHDYAAGNTIVNPQLRANRDSLGIPQGTAIALPSIRTAKEDEEKINPTRTIYGGEGDKQHLGGFTDFDISGVSPAVWKEMVQYMGVKSIITLLFLALTPPQMVVTFHMSFVE